MFNRGLVMRKFYKFDDHDNNGVELYWDKPKELWTYKEDGSLEMFTKQLDLENLLEELNQE
jgi:catechol 2,3-dioxygenase